MTNLESTCINVCQKPSNPPTHMTTAIELNIPSTRISCAGWICKQEPNTVADCLDVCQASFHALQRELGHGEASRLLNQVEELQRTLELRTSEYKTQVDENRKEYKKQCDIAIQREKEQCVAKIEKLKKETEEEHQEVIKNLSNELDQGKRDHRKLQEKYAEYQKKASADHESMREELLEEKKAAVVRAHLAQAETVQKLEDSNKALKSELEESISQQQRTHANLRRQLEEDHEKALLRVKEKEAIAIRELQQQLNTKDDRCRAEIANEREELRRQMLDDFSKERKEAEHRLALATNDCEQQKLLANKYWQEFTSTKQELQALHEQMHIAAARHSNELQQIQKNKDEETQKLQTEKNDVLDRYHEFASGFKTSSAIGKFGEDFVQRIHAAMGLGEWEDTSRIRESGYADALWTMDFTAGKMKCLEDTKHTQQLHSKDDIKKFATDVETGARLGRINAAMMISLKARIPNTRQLQLDIQHGIPVLRASREFDDPLPALTLVQLALTTMASAWPLLQRTRGNEADDALQAACDFLDDQLSKATQISKVIIDLEKQSRMTQKLVDNLTKTRDGIIKDVNGLRIQYAQLNSTVEEEEENIFDPWADPNLKEVLACIHKHKLEKNHNKYPKSMADVEITAAAQDFLERWPEIEFKTLIEKAKASVKRGQKRPISDVQEDVNDFEDVNGTGS